MVNVKHRDVDRGWAWVVMASSVLIITIISGMDAAYGIFQVEFVESFPNSQGFIALIVSFAFGGRFLLGPVSGIISDLMSCRVTVMAGGAFLCVGAIATSFLHNLAGIFFTLGVCFGIGSGLVFTAAMSMISAYFDRYRTLAFGISLTAPGIGAITATRLVTWLIVGYGWHLAMAYLSYIFAQILVLGALFFPLYPHLSPTRRRWSADRPVANGHGPDTGETTTTITTATQREESDHLLENDAQEDTEVTAGSERTRQRLKNLLCQKFLWVVCLSQMMMIASYTTAFNFFPSYARSIGVPSEDVPTLYTAYGVCLILARFGGGVLFNRIPGHLLKVLFCANLGYCLTQGFLPLYGISFRALFVERFLSSITFGPSLLVQGPILVRHLGPKNLPVAFGLVMFSGGVGAISVPPIAGALYDVYGSYDVCYYLAGSVGMLSALSLLLTAFLSDHRHHSG